MGQIRLACIYCDRVDHDGVDDIPADWFSLGDVQEGNELLVALEWIEPANSWYTHLGICPECDQDDAELPALVTI